VKDDSVYLRHIRDALADISTYTAAGRDAFFAERMRQDATLRKLEIIGQAVKNLSDDSRLREPDIQWKRIAGMRDKVIHDYFGVNLEIVWRSSRRNYHASRPRSTGCLQISAGTSLPTITAKTEPVATGCCANADSLFGKRSTA
jgi:uncharacterized protein with HEPN domain